MITRDTEPQTRKRKKVRKAAFLMAFNKNFVDPLFLCASVSLWLKFF